MGVGGLDPAYAAELVRRADALQAEASRVVAELDLGTLLGRLGIFEQVGSSVTGLMVWRDIDLGARCRELTLDRAWDALRPLLVNPHVIAVDYHDETGGRSPSGLASDQRYSYVVRYEAAPGEEWRLDISLWLSDAPRNQLAQAEAIRRRLSEETRLAILWIKDVWRQLPVYPSEVGGVEVYDAVLEHGVRTPEEFEGYLRERGLPGR
ncbi:MAG TPA: hypothetical protein VH482_16450 [Thermomicrobiales bacterium]|jgi:hypothetical protein